MRAFVVETFKALLLLVVGCLVTKQASNSAADCSCAAAVPASRLCFVDRAASLKIMGLGPEASVKDVQSAYLQLAKEHHPDKAREASTEVSRLSCNCSSFSTQ
jgi:DnaJ domain